MKRESAERPRGFAMDRRSVCTGMVGLATAAIWAPMSGCGGKKAALDDTVAETAYGKLRGSSEGPVKVFKGIPYGTNTAETRFMLPAPPKPWTGERDATKYGAMTPQRDRPYQGARSLLSSWNIPQEKGEDCLVLNVWTPGLRSNSKRPVMVWLHGGGFSAGSGATNAYDGARLAQRGDVVVVTVNHRLNIFGYMYLAELGGEQYADSGNVGQHDLIAALQWVRDNIAEFGGDPGNVMIFGESGGAGKVCSLLAMPQAQGLFHRAAAESGHLVWGSDPAAATQSAKEALQLLNVAPTDLAALNKLTTQQIMDAYYNLPPASIPRMAPVRDGRGLPRDPFAPDATAVSANVPLLIGINRTETTYLFPDPKNFELTWEDLPARIKRYIGDVDAAKVVSDYRALMPPASASDIFFDVTTQITMGRNAYMVADRKSALKAAPVYFYHLTWNTPADGGRWRCPHTLEIPFVFDNVPKVPSMFGGTPPPEAQQMADYMSEAWIAFARTGKPGTSKLPDWPAYDAEQRQVMQFDLQCAIVKNPLGRQIDILKNAPDWDMTRSLV
jgi:para-nitrobenzyl esterase